MPQCKLMCHCNNSNRLVSSVIIVGDIAGAAQLMKYEPAGHMTYQADRQTCIVFLIRHAATANNLATPPKIQGHASDISLSAEGLAQAQQTAQLLATETISAVYTSPVRRAAQTAAAVAASHNLVPVPVHDLREVDVGRWEGRSWVEIARDEPEAHQRFLTNPAVHGYAGGENLSELVARVQPAFEQVAERHRGQCIAVIGHNVVNRVLLATYLEVLLPRAREIHQDNCGVSVLRVRRGRVKVLTANSAFHLELRS